MKDTEKQIVKWIKEKVKDAKKDGVIIGLSGGIDSAVTAALCKKAFPKTTLGLILSCNTDVMEICDAVTMARKFNIKTKTISITPIYDMFKTTFEKLPKMASANIIPRLRMTALYAIAQKYNYLVVGTTNKTEYMVGYVTKYGDGGVDIEPIGDLLKKDVRVLAKHLGIPKDIIKKAPSAGLWDGQTDEKEMGITYKELDKEFTELNDPVLASFSKNKKIRNMVLNSAHKRLVPPICKITTSD